MAPGFPLRGGQSKTALHLYGLAWSIGVMESTKKAIIISETTTVLCDPSYVFKVLYQHSNTPVLSPSRRIYEPEAITP